MTALIRLLVSSGRAREIALEKLALCEQRTLLKRHSPRRDCEKQMFVLAVTLHLEGLNKNTGLPHSHRAGGESI